MARQYEVQEASIIGGWYIIRLSNQESVVWYHDSLRWMADKFCAELNGSVWLGKRGN